MLDGFLARIFRRADAESDADNEAAWRLYRAAVEQARSPAFYTDYGVADSIDGRFDLIILHVILLVRRLRREGDRGAAMAQALFDATFADMDRSLREMGVGDLGVGRRVKAMARAYFGRADAYEAALDFTDAAPLVEALRRNVFDSASESTEAAAALAVYVRQVEGALGDQEAYKLMAGEVSMAVPIVPAKP